MQFIEDRNKKLIQELETLIYSDSVPIEHYKMACTGSQWTDADAVPEELWQEFSRLNIWGGHNTYFWFTADLVIPEEFDGKCVVFQLITGREGGWDADNPQFRVYINGELKQGLDVNHREVLLSESAKKGEVYHLCLSAFTGNKNYYLKLESEIKILHRDIERYYYDLAVPKSVQDLLDCDSREAITIEEALTKSLNLLDLRQPYSHAFYESLNKAQAWFEEEFYEKKCGGSTETVFTVGHTHIDVAWLWPLSVTRDKAVRSFSSMLELMRQYPEFLFMSSQPQLYKYVKELAPEVYQEIRQRIKEGRWEAEGGMFLEADCNLSSGESLVRQFIYGKRFFKDEFGVDNVILWLPDVFGYSAALPQIMEKCGIKYFMTTKISWSETNKMPYDTFQWEGIDGTRILTHFISARDYNAGSISGGKKRPSHFTTYNGIIDASQTKGTWQRYSQKKLNSETLMCFGYGDGGGGPTKEMLENQRRLAKGIPGCPKTQMGTARQYFELLDANVSGKPELPVWVGELYLEYHRGTYTSMARNKRWNRKGEFLLENLESLETMVSLMGAGRESRREEIRNLWEILLRNQFHDILPGSSVKEVYEDSKEEYNQLFSRGNLLKKEMLELLTAKTKAEKGGLVVHNFNGFEGTDAVICPYPDELKNPAALKDGILYPIQKVNDSQGVFLAKNIPSKGRAGYDVVESEEVLQNLITFDGSVVETPYFRVRLNEKGEFTSFVDKRNGREILKKGCNGNTLVTYEDRPHNYDAWDINDYYVLKPFAVEDTSGLTVSEQGPVRLVIRVAHQYLDSVIEQNLVFYAELDRIDIVNKIDWKEKNILLRSYFPLDIHAGEAAYEIQYGNVKRPTHYNTSWDEAKFEVCAHKWIDLSEDNYGVSVLNDCKYGCDIHDGIIGLTFLKSAVYPNPDADKEYHEFSYSICPHEGSWKTSGTINKAYLFNNPMEVCVKDKADENNLPELPFVTSDSENVIIEVMKNADQGDGIILRLYETFNRTCDAALTFALPVKKAVQCDMLETDQKELETEENRVKISVKPYEIKTVRVVFDAL